MTECTAPDCEYPTDLYLCNTCTCELATTLSTIPALIPVLYMIGRKEEKAFTVGSSRGGGGGPTLPININAIALAQELTTALERTAPQYAQDPEGSPWKEWITQRAKTANTMVNGEEEQTVTTDYINYRMKQILPMPTRKLVPWFEENMGIHLTPERIKKWGQRGVIDRRNGEGGHPHYHPADILRAHYESRAS